MMRNGKGPQCQRASAVLANVQHPDRLQNDIAGDLEALGAKLVHCVLNRMVEDVVVAVVEVDDVGAGHAAFNERQVIVFDLEAACEEVRLISEFRGSLVDK